MAVKRAYDSSGRREQARQTRRRVLDAAAELFVDPGYAAATIAMIARRAQVAPQTVTGAFGTKRQLLSDLIDVTIAGDDEPVPVPERPFVARVATEPTGRGKLRIYAEHLVETHRRQAGVMRALAGAAQADPDVAAIWQKNRTERLAGMRMFATALDAAGCLRPGMTVERAAQVLWLAMDASAYTWLVDECGWTDAEFVDWYVDGVSALLLTAGDAGS